MSVVQGGDGKVRRSREWLGGGEAAVAAGRRMVNAKNCGGFRGRSAATSGGDRGELRAKG